MWRMKLYTFYMLLIFQMFELGLGDMGKNSYSYINSDLRYTVYISVYSFLYLYFKKSVFNIYISLIAQCCPTKQYRPIKSNENK